MYKVVRKLSEKVLEDFGTFNNYEEAENMAKVIEVFLGYKNIYILEN